MDAVDRVIGEASRSLVHNRNLLHPRGTCVCSNPTGILDIAKKIGSKRLGAYALDLKLFGARRQREQYAESAIRECGKELGLELGRSEMRKSFGAANVRKLDTSSSGYTKRKLQGESSHARMRLLKPLN